MTTKNTTKKEEKGMNSSQGLNLYQKLVKVREKADFIKKDTKGYAWKYADEHAILSAIRPVLDELNIWVDQEMESLETVDITVGGKVSSALQVKIRYHIIDGDNPQDSITREQFMIEPGVDCKKVGSILTYANRYFWFKFLQIPQSEKEDIEKTPPISNENLVKASVKSEKEVGEIFMSHFDDAERPALQSYVSWLSKETKKTPTQTVEMCLKNMDVTKHNYSEWKGPTIQHKSSKTVSMRAV